MLNNHFTDSNINKAETGINASESIAIGSSIQEAYDNINIGGDVLSRRKQAFDLNLSDVATSVGISNEFDETVSFSNSSLFDPIIVKINGLGIWIDKLDLCQNENIFNILDVVQSLHLTHVVLKIADGTLAQPEGIHNHLARDLSTALREKGIKVWGWHRLRCLDLEREALVGIHEVFDLKLDGYIADLDTEVEKISSASLKMFFNNLRESFSLSNVPLGCSIFPYPSFHRDLPWKDILSNVDFLAPRIYWEQAHNPGAQLRRCVDEFSRLAPNRLIFPIGSAYGLPNWEPTPSDFAEFVQTAKDLDLVGVGFFKWDWLGKLENRESLQILQSMNWESLQSRKKQTKRISFSDNQNFTRLKANSDISHPTFVRKFPHIIWNDEVENVDDRLGFESYVDAFVKLVLDERTQPPLAIGISGAWGSGKSFLLSAIKGKLEGRKVETKTRRQQSTLEKPVYVVNFNAWDYNSSDAVWPGLVRGILDKLEESVGYWGRSLSRMKRNLTRQIGDIRNKLLPWVLLFIAAMIAVAVITRGNWQLFFLSISVLGFGGMLAILKMITDLPVAQWITGLFNEGRDYGTAIGYMEEIRKDISELKKRLPQKTKIVVIIDDLDRCNSDKIAETLEAIKLLLVFDIFIVFLAIDANVISRAIEKRYKEMLAEAGRSGYLFLEKIIQIPFRIPEPDSSMLDRYLFGLLSAFDNKPSGNMPELKAKNIARNLSTYLNLSADTLSIISLLPNDHFTSERILEDIKDALKPYVSHASHDVRFASLVWALLARWWPATTYVMHETMRSEVSNQGNDNKSGSDLSELIKSVEHESKEDITIQRLREVADSSSQAYLEIIKLVLPISQMSLFEVLKLWKVPYSITLGFSQAEIEAFRNLSRYLFKNPRHIKRLINTYSLIRMLAARASEGTLITNAPEATLKWLILSSQWPLTAQVMLQSFQDEIQNLRAGEQLANDDDALGRLYEKANQRISSSAELQKERSKLDGDPILLKRLIGDGVRVLTSKQLELFQVYSINFNPAEASIPHLVAIPVASRNS
jgi:hypothetical protein